MEGWEYFQRAEELFEEANHVGHTDRERGQELVQAAMFHATMANTLAAANPRAFWLQKIHAENADE